MIFPNGIWILIIVSLLLCCMGFCRFVWFMSVGYGLSVAGIGAALLIMALTQGSCTVIFALQCLVFIVYGIRLGGFLFVRELKNVKYREKMAEAGGNAKLPVFVGAFVWIFCGFLYVMQTSGPVYRLLNGMADKTTAAQIIGLIISIIGVALEALADKQKGLAKTKNPDMPAMDGLYKMCRCPNYFGEILVWTGAFISGIGAFTGAQWAVGIIGYIAIVIIMLSGAKRVETRHIKHYGQKDAYNAYADSTPLLIPLIPFYHMTNPDKIAREEAAKKAKAANKKKH